MDQKIDTPRAQSGTVAVLIPCYNEAVTIGKVVDDFRRVLPEATVYVYDNNSSDGTASIAAEHGAVVRAERRQGKGNVVRQMLRDIDADYYVMVDGDDTYPAEAAPELLAPLMADEADMSVGDRLSNGTYGEENDRAFHGFGNDLVRTLIKWIYGFEFSDFMTGYRAFNAVFAKTMPVLSPGFEIETELSIHAADADKATDLGSAFHRAAQLAVETGRVPGAARLGVLSEAYALSTGQRARLVDACERWFSSATYAETLQWGLRRAEVPFFVPISDAFVEGEIDLLCTDDAQLAGARALVVDY